ncbi:MAG: SsrA-binding protein, partial [Selenomonadaceae bacterium]|nr:SsrA-binding protein [Selenomonadaceae bacterium]
KLFGKTREKGFTLVPLKIYFKKGRAKLELALASGKHTYDKRNALHEKSAQRDVERALKERSR